MQNAFRAFMNELIDYAGLFPPAKLPLTEALPNYLAYKQSADAWMLSRFIIPAQQLEALSDLLGENSISLSILGQGGEDFLVKLASDMEKVKAFRQRHGEKVETDFFELRLPKEISLSLLEEAGKLIGEGMNVFYEVPPTELAMLDTIAAYNQNHPSVSLKLRCGGETAAAFPSVEAVAAFIAAARDRNLAFKATAGLHHPIRHYNESVQTRMHGFLNLFGAGLLATAHSLDTEALIPILADEDASNFLFTDDYFSWKGLHVSTEKIERIRERMNISYGSCSFDEPREDLAALNLLETMA